MKVSEPIRTCNYSRMLFFTIFIPTTIQPYKNTIIQQTSCYAIAGKKYCKIILLHGTWIEFTIL